MDRYVTVTQGETFYITEALATLEGMEKGPAGNTSLTAAFALAQELPEDAIIVAQETEYTGAGKGIMPQLSFARRNGIELKFGDPAESTPGKDIIFPADPGLLKVKDLDMARLYKSHIKHSLHGKDPKSLTDEEVAYLVEECKHWTEEQVREHLASM